MNAIFAFVAIVQGIGALVLLRRLLPALRRAPAVPPYAEPITDTTVSVIVPTLNEVTRLAPCLDGLARQREPLAEVIVVDSGSTDGTRELVLESSRRDPRVRLEEDPPLPRGWIGKVWALQHGLSRARGEWVLGLDADVEPNDGLVGGVVTAAEQSGYELVSFAPMFAGQSAAERWVQPALLASLVYRTGAPGSQAPARSLLANGQCFLVRRSVLLEHGGYGPARDSFADDVRLARHYARSGVPCGFLDGRLLYRVRSYRSIAEMWREWGRSIDLADATPPLRQWLDLLLLLVTQLLPVPILLSAFFASVPFYVVAVNVLLLGIRIAVVAALASSYERRGAPFYLSVLADPAAVVRVTWSTFSRPVAWRGRRYG